MEPVLKKITWKEAATGGLILGLAFIVVMIIGYIGELDLTQAWITGALNFAALIAVIFIYAKKMSYIHGDNGFSYAQSMGFILRMMLFAGIIAGVGQFIIQNYVDPEYYRDIFEAALLNQGLPENLTEEVRNSMWVLKNPILMIFSGMINMIIYGGLVGVVISAFVKKLPKPQPENQAGQSDNAENPQQ